MPSVFETEIKLKIPDRAEADRLLHKLNQLASSSAKENLQLDVYYDTKNGELQRSDLVIRTRVLNDKAFVALKSPRVFIGEAIQKRIELEFEIQDYQAVLKQFKDQNLIGTSIIEKKRAEFNLGESLIAFDELPFIGRFLEIEANDIAAIEKIISNLGINSYERVRLNYGELLDKKMLEIDLPQRPNLNASFKHYEAWKSKNKRNE